MEPTAAVGRRHPVREPLREGGSLPGLMEADDDGLYVVKFRGAGQGPAGARRGGARRRAGAPLGLPVPELVLVELDPELAQAEPDPEIQDLLERQRRASTSGVDFLPGALPFTPAAVAALDPELAADVVWLDALTTNVDRTPRNPNLLVWHGRTWLIDHGAALYIHHGWRAAGRAPRRPFPPIADHVLLPRGGLDRRGRRAPGAAARRGRAARPPWRWCPRTGSARTRQDAGAATSSTSWPRACAAPRAFVEEAERARACVRRVPVRDPAGRAPRSSAARRSTPASSLIRRQPASCGARRTSTRSGWRRSRPASTPTSVRPRSRRSARVAGRPGAGPIAALPRSERFGWVVAPSSTIIQPSPSHTGLTEDPAATLERLFATLVGTPPG